MSYFRAVTYQTFGLPRRPAVELAVAFGPLVIEEQRADNLINVLTRAEQDREHRKQHVVFDSIGD